MAWSFYTDVDDALHDWLKSLYLPYRDTLTPVEKLPLDTEIDWDSYWAGVNSTSFIVYEDVTTLGHLALGTKTPQLEGTQIVRVTHRWINAGKSPYIKEFREFVTRTIYENLSPLPAALSNEGVYWMMPIQSRVFQDTSTAQEDFWTMELRVATKVLNTTI
jgi:hypothetical protein